MHGIQSVTTTTILIARGTIDGAEIKSTIAENEMSTATTAKTSTNLAHLVYWKGRPRGKNLLPRVEGVEDAIDKRRIGRLAEDEIALIRCSMGYS